MQNIQDSEKGLTKFWDWSNTSFFSSAFSTIPPTFQVAWFAPPTVYILPYSLVVNIPVAWFGADVEVKTPGASPTTFGNFCWSLIGDVEYTRH